MERTDNNTNYMIKRIGHITALRYLLLAATFMLTAVSCTREDWSDCDPLLQIGFSFTRNPSGTERFYDELTRLDVFIFDAQGRFVKSISDSRTRFPDGYVMETELPGEGTYSIVTVGNADNTFEYGQFKGYSQA